MLQFKKIAPSIVLGLIFTQGAIMLVPNEVKAQSGGEELSAGSDNGTCFYRKKDICGLDGHNYPDHAYQGG